MSLLGTFSSNAWKRRVLPFIFIQALAACSDSSNSEPVNNEPDPVVVAPTNKIITAYIKDTNGEAKRLGGDIVIELEDIDDDYRQGNWFELYWINQQQQVASDAFATITLSDGDVLTLTDAAIIPEGISDFAIIPANSAGQSTTQTSVHFRDLIGNYSLAGAGGNEETSWRYGEDKDLLQVQKIGNDCVFDNGLVAVIDMHNEKDELWASGHYDGGPNIVDNTAFPVYQFDCETTPFHDLDKIEDDWGIWTHSTNNDALHFGTMVYDALLEVLKRPPLDDLIRIRTHYHSRWREYAYWDGAYMNFGDGFPFVYSYVVLDIVAHEVAHAILSDVSALKAFEGDLTIDATTAHEAFADIVGVVVKHKHQVEQNLWLHGKEAGGLFRSLDSIKTEYSAVDSYLDYDDAGANPYLRIGLLTYPFYLLAQQYGIEPSFNLYLSAAKQCWYPDMTLLQAGSCIVEVSQANGFTQSDVVAAFQQVKMAFDDQTLLSHFEYEIEREKVTFADSSVSPNSIQQWQWSFGDGQTSTEQNPTHNYQATGSYQVTLEVTNTDGKTDTFHRYIFIDLRDLP